MWPHEALDFTPWLSQDDNISLLADAIGIDSLVRAFGLSAYIDIPSVIQQDNFVATPEFRKTFNGFYRVRQKSAA